MQIFIASLQIRSKPLGPVLPSPAALLLDWPIRSIMPIMNYSPINTDNDSDHYEALVQKNKSCYELQYAQRA